MHSVAWQHREGAGWRVGGAAFVAMIALALLSCGRGPPSTPSPDGKYQLYRSIHRDRERGRDQTVGFRITNASGATELEELTGASDLGSWQLDWDKDDRVWLDSSDLGVCYWERKPDGTWQRTAWHRGDSPPPPPWIKVPR